MKTYSIELILSTAVHDLVQLTTRTTFYGHISEVIHYLNTKKQTISLLHAQEPSNAQS